MMRFKKKEVTIDLGVHGDPTTPTLNELFDKIRWAIFDWLSVSSSSLLIINLIMPFFLYDVLSSTGIFIFSRS